MIILQEVWKDIPGYEGMYQASTHGRIRSLRILKSRLTTGTGYPAVVLPSEPSSPSRRQSNRHVHALVAAAFLGPRPRGMHIDHKDGDRANPQPDNLEYVTPKENNHRSFVVGKNRHRLSDHQMDEIANLYFEEGWSALGIANSLKLDIKVIHSVVGIWRATQRKGRRNPYEHKLTAEKAQEIRKLYARSELTQAQIARLYNVHPAHVSRILSGQLWPEGSRKRRFGQRPMEETQ